MPDNIKYVRAVVLHVSGNVFDDMFFNDLNFWVLHYEYLDEQGLIDNSSIPF